MNLRFLETFLWVAKLRSFSSAAEKLHTTQAAVSNRIATLERDLGVRLFERDLRTVRLTPQGQDALRRAEEIVRLATEFRDLAGDGSRLRGSIAIGTVDTIVYAWLPRLIEQMKNRYPNVSMDLAVDTSLNIARQLQEGTVDLGILMGPVIGPDIHNLEICSFDCVWFAAAGLDLPAEPLELSDLVRVPILAYSRGSQPHHAILRLLARVGIQPDEARIYNTNSIATMIRLLCDRVGVTTLPRCVVQEHLDAGRIREIEVNAAIPPLHFHAAYAERPGNPIPAAIAGMAAEIAADFRAATETGPA
ncbi:LysR family transcriptional regulator [Prosthecomicrobium sp. N25]|uniref:LysR family transcriptional regulator n=1 Tax=Prosthecomicrobium sp. N25 TaxID=3129254 RepID=UPI003077B1F0